MYLDTRVFVRHDRLVLDLLALDVAAPVQQLGDLVPAPVVDVDLAHAHRFVSLRGGEYFAFFRTRPLVSVV